MAVTIRAWATFKRRIPFSAWASIAALIVAEFAGEDRVDSGMALKIESPIHPANKPAKNAAPIAHQITILNRFCIPSPAFAASEATDPSEY